MTLEEKDLSLLIALQENPLAPASKLAKSIGQSTPTVISRLNALKEDQSYFSVSADVKPESLELEIIDVLLKIDNFEDVEYFEKHISFNHPFTLFRIRCFGKINGIYAQFRIPIGSKQLLVDLIDHLKSIGKIQDYFLPSTWSPAYAIYSKANLSCWEPQLMRWIFDWKKWFSKYDKQSTQPVARKLEQSYLQNIDELDAALLEEITMDARRKNTDIMDNLKLDKNHTGLPQKVSRKLNFLYDKIAFQFRVFLQWETFEIFNSFLAICQCSRETSSKLQNLLAKEEIPFQSVFKITNEGFLWYIRCPASHFSNISEIIWKIGDKVDFYFLDYKNSSYYGLWKGAYDAQNHQWKTELMKKEEVIK
ncbi:MAG: AsnC family transcriptional regulator [Candidatus Thorarchaeota archaeon]